MDYDSARHNYATTHKTKKKDGGIKITKVKQIQNILTQKQQHTDNDVIYIKINTMFYVLYSDSLLQPSSLLERATPGWAQGILSAHNVAQSSLSRSQVRINLTARPIGYETMIRCVLVAQQSKTQGL